LEIGLQGKIEGHSVYMMLDTGVNPSVIDLASADALGLMVDRREQGEASGFGNGHGAAVFPTTIAGLTILGHHFTPFASLATDLSALSRHYGRTLDAVLGYSFLSNKTILIDYPEQNLDILDNAAEATPFVHMCGLRWTKALTTVDDFPIIPDFVFGAASGPISIDTGSNGGMELFQTALDLPGLRVALVKQGAITHSGARGDSIATTYKLNAPIGFGPFTLPAGQVVAVYNVQGSPSTRVANAGNALFAAMKVKMLLDYRGGMITFYGNCH
jgi:hypothetical protein